jgi:hypothetical protein
LENYLFESEIILKFFIDLKLKFDSTVLDIGLQKQIVNLYDFPVGQKSELKYRASRDGFKSKDFHSHCDGIALRSLCEYKDSITGGREYTFDFQEIHIKGLLGCFKEVEKGTF